MLRRTPLTKSAADAHCLLGRISFVFSSPGTTLCCLPAYSVPANGISWLPSASSRRRALFTLFSLPLLPCFSAPPSPAHTMVASAKRGRAVTAPASTRPPRGVPPAVPLQSSGRRPPPPPPLSLPLVNGSSLDGRGCQVICTFPTSARPWPAAPPSPRARALAKENRRLRAAAVALSRRIAAAERALAARGGLGGPWSGRAAAA